MAFSSSPLPVRDRARGAQFDDPIRENCYTIVKCNHFLLRLTGASGANFITKRILPAVFTAFLRLAVSSPVPFCFFCGLSLFPHGNSAVRHAPPGAWWRSTRRFDPGPSSCSCRKAKIGMQTPAPAGLATASSLYTNRPGEAEACSGGHQFPDWPVSIRTRVKSPGGASPGAWGSR